MSVLLPFTAVLSLVYVVFILGSGSHWLLFLSLM